MFKFLLKSLHTHSIEGNSLALNFKEGLAKSHFNVRQSGFFLLTPSPWPLFSSFAVFLTLTGFAAYMNYYEGGLFCFFCGIFFILLSFFFWCRDLIREMTFFGRTSVLIETNIRWAFWFFIVSEALLFVSFFWAFFHSSLEPVIQLGAVWPPLESIQMNSLDIPIFNTVFLLASGAALTWAQYGIIGGQHKDVTLGFVVLFIYAIFFMMSQWQEYAVAFHQVNDSVFGSSMYILTMFHGAHVMIGSLFLFICFLRFLLGHFRPVSYLALTLAAWYWHFVDVVWVLVFLWIYLWGTWIPHWFKVDFVENLITGVYN
jgi:heme/copper-type cytochrome/quinol oxidase subunit 3